MPSSRMLMAAALLALYLALVALSALFRPRALKNLFVGSFLCALFLPLIFFNAAGTYSALENRALAAAPALVRVTDGGVRLNAGLPRAFDDYVNDRFGFKKYLVRLNNLLRYTVLKGRKSGRALIGRGNWLFYIDKDDGNNLADFQKKNLLDDASISAAVARVMDRAAWCEAHGIAFVFLIAPNKHSVYPEFYPFERPEGPTRADQIMAGLPDTLRGAVLFPRDYLLAKKRETPYPLYYKTGTHWNKLGAFYANELLFEKIQAAFPETRFPELSFKGNVVQDDGEDSMANMLGLESYGDPYAILDVAPEDGWERHYAYVKNEGRGGVVTQNADPGLPSAVIFRDSFFTALEPFTSSVFSRAEYLWKSFDEAGKAYVLERRPDVVIWETAERYAASRLLAAD